MHVRAKVCGVANRFRLPLRLHEYGDLRMLPASLGAPIVEMGAIQVDNLGTGFFDDAALKGLSLNPLSSTGSVIGRSVAVYASGSESLVARSIHWLRCHVTTRLCHNSPHIMLTITSNATHPNP